MNTPNLDALMGKAESPHVCGENAADERLKELFVTHGPALVAVLKYYAGTAIGARAVDVLLKIDQEATCQK